MEQLKKSNIGVQASKGFISIQKTKKKQSYTPFLFRARKPQFQSSSPAPGHYENKSCFTFNEPRNLIRQAYNRQMQNSKIIQESSNFKSSAKRFKDSVSQMNNQDFYISNESQTFRYQNENKKKRFHHIRSNTQSQKKQSLASSYPSIPGNSLKYGYSLSNNSGKLDVINKTDLQILKEKEDMKKYVKRLNGERIYLKSQSRHTQNIRKSQTNLLHKLKESVNFQKNLSANTIPTYRTEQFQKKTHFVSKILPKKNSKCNQQRIKNILIQKMQNSRQLGPGSYQVQNKKIGQNTKPKKFQFFNSTSQRFKFYEQNQQIQVQVNKVRPSAESILVKVRRSLKKPQRFSDKTQFKQKCVNPGPGEYNPNPNIIKKSIAKKTCFERSARFAEDKQNNFTLHKSPNKRALKYIDLKSYESRGVPKGQSDYSICSWENRPLSRTQVA